MTSRKRGRGMTREEAVKELIDMANMLCLNPDTPQGIALKMAIKALQQMPEHTKCDQCPYGEIEVRNICNYDGHGCGWD